MPFLSDPGFLHRLNLLPTPYLRQSDKNSVYGFGASYRYFRDTLGLSGVGVSAQHLETFAGGGGHATQVNAKVYLGADMLSIGLGYRVHETRDWTATGRYTVQLAIEDPGGLMY